jgi:predicted HAD superfamily hydrolase
MKHIANSAIAKANYDLFPELATTLLYFIARLHDALVEQGVRQVYFLSREGQPLKRMFDLYQNKVSGSITSYYLEVSRRSTLLPSLEPLAEEGFETLFRQYRRISLFEFLSSLGLEAQMRRIFRQAKPSVPSKRSRYSKICTSQSG